MISMHRRALVAPLLLLLLVAIAVPAVAELRTVPREDGGFSTILMTIVDHPDPVDVAAWDIFTPLTPLVLNPDGAVRGDGRPDLIADRATGQPIVVWSFNAGPDRDVVISSWSGDHWKPLESIAATALDELDPRVAIDDDGRLLVAWWTPDDGVYFAASSPAGDGEWTMPARITDPGRGASRPSLLVNDGEVLVAYERLAGEGPARELVVARQTADGSFDKTVVAVTEEAERLDPILHASPGLVWVDWKHGVELYGHAVAVGGDWSDWSMTVLSSRTWIDVEAARAIIRSELIAP